MTPLPAQLTLPGVHAPEPAAPGSPKSSEIACNRCNHGRRRSVHPCPKCRCPEYRLLKKIDA